MMQGDYLYMFFHINLSKPIKLIKYSYFENICNSDIHIAKSFSNSHFLLIFADGSATIHLSNTQKITLQQKNWIITSSNLKMVFTGNPSSSISFYIFEFISNTIIEKSLSPFIERKSPEEITLPQIGIINDMQELEELLNRFTHSKNGSSYKYTLNTNYLFSTVLLNLGEQFIHFVQEGRAKKIPAKFELIIQWISQHSDDELSVSIISNKFNITPEYLTHLFNHYEGMSTTKFIHNLKISRAKDLLLTTNMSIKQIGYYLSFNNIKYFMRLFKKETALTPTAFRKNFSIIIPSIERENGN